MSKSELRLEEINKRIEEIHKKLDIISCNPNFIDNNLTIEQNLHKQSLLDELVRLGDEQCELIHRTGKNML